MKKCVIAFIGAMVLMPFLLTSCGSGSGSVTENRSNRGYNPGVGPFDSNGNYVERWADDKSKGRWWRKSSSSTSNAVAKTTPTKPTPSKVLPPVATTTITPQPSSAVPRRPVVTPPVGNTATRPSPPVAVTPKPKPKPKPVARTKPKSKPPIAHTIKKGDTLYGLSRKYGASISSIQRANGLKGTNLRIGQKLLIPRY